MPNVYGQAFMRTEAGSKDLDKLIGAYSKLSSSEVFRDLATKYFRDENLGQLLSQALAQKKQLGRLSL